MKTNRLSNHKITESEYAKVHYWLRKNLGKAQSCSNIWCTGKSSCFDWALIRGKKYEYKVENFMNLCKSCHIIYDRTDESIKRMVKNSYMRRQTHCKNGHKYEGDNLYMVQTTRQTNPYRLCRICKKDRKTRYLQKLKAINIIKNQ